MCRSGNLGIFSFGVKEVTGFSSETLQGKALLSLSEPEFLDAKSGTCQSFPTYHCCLITAEVFRLLLISLLSFYCINQSVEITVTS